MPRIGRPPSDTVQVSVRVASAWADRAAVLAEKLERDGYKSDKASVYRAALGRGLDALEAEHGIKPKGKR